MIENKNFPNSEHLRGKLALTIVRQSRVRRAQCNRVLLIISDLYYIDDVSLFDQPRQGSAGGHKVVAWSRRNYQDTLLRLRANCKRQEQKYKVG